MADPEAPGDGVEEALEPPPPQQPLLDEILPGEQAGAGDRRIPIVETLDSEPDLPPNWDTGPLPPRPGGVADNLPPLPPSLGSVSGRASSRSGYTPSGGGGIAGLHQGGPSRAGSQRGVRTIGNRNHLSSGTPTLASHSGGSVRRIEERPFNLTGRYVNVDTASQNMADRMEGPAREPGAEAMGAAWLGLGPPIPARNLSLATAPRPSQPHPGRLPNREFFELGARAYTAYGDYEVTRMVAYRHLGLPAPAVNILPTVTTM